MESTLLSQLIVYLVFGWLGYLWGTRLALPDKTAKWVLWLILLVLADSLIKMQLANIFGFVVDTQSILQALVAGILINFVVRASRREKASLSPSGTVKS